MLALADQLPETRWHLEKANPCASGWLHCRAPGVRLTHRRGPPTFDQPANIATMPTITENKTMLMEIARTIFRRVVVLIAQNLVSQSRQRYGDRKSGCADPTSPLREERRTSTLLQLGHRLGMVRSPARNAEFPQWTAVAVRNGIRAAPGERSPTRFRPRGRGQACRSCATARTGHPRSKKWIVSFVDIRLPAFRRSVVSGR